MEKIIDNCTDCSCENIMQPCEACINNRVNRGNRSKTSLLDDCVVDGELLLLTADQRRKLKRQNIDFIGAL